MSIIKLASAVTALGLLLAASPAFAQTVCPEASEGTPCDGGFCVPATCNFATGDGGTTESACGLCIPSEPGQCVASIPAMACPGGETCVMNAGGGGGSAGGGAGGGHPDAGTLTGFQYSVGMCVVPHEGGTPEEDGGRLGADDASAVSANDDAAAYGGGTETAAAAERTRRTTRMAVSHAALKRTPRCRARRLGRRRGAAGAAAWRQARWAACGCRSASRASGSRSCGVGAPGGGSHLSCAGAEREQVARAAEAEAGEPHRAHSRNRAPCGFPAPAVYSAAEEPSRGSSLVLCWMNLRGG